jgi:hypothetical protein
MIFTISDASSSAAREAFTRVDTGHRCNIFLAAGLRVPIPALQLSHGSELFGSKITGIRSWTSATNLFDSVMTIEQDFNAAPRFNVVPFVP